MTQANRLHHANLISDLMHFARDNRDLVVQSNTPAWKKEWNIPRQQSAEASRLLAVTGRDVLRHHALGPRYHHIHDQILLPFPRQFDGDYQELTAVAHELVHWTGHSSRLDRPTLKGCKKGTPLHGAEECIAELGACLIIDALGHKVHKPWHLNYMLCPLDSIPDEALDDVWPWIIQEASRACDLIITRMEG